MLYYNHSTQYSILIEKEMKMKQLIAMVLLTVTTLATAQVYVPGGGVPLCFPQTVATPTGPVTIVICQ